MGETYAGITVPEGEPESVRSAATVFQGVAGGLYGAGSDLRSMPGLVADWRGPASAAYSSTCNTNGGCIDTGAEAMGNAAQTATTYADALEAAQDEARAAIAEARDAQRRIDAAQADIESAQSAQVSASSDMEAADHRIAMSTVHGVPDTGAVADFDRAAGAYADAEAAEATARRNLEQAQADLERAQERGNQAEQAARDAARTAAAAFDGIAGGSPAAAVFGGSPSAIEDGVLARVRAGDYTVLDEVPLNYLPADTQQAIAAEIARDADEAAYGEGDHSIDEIAGIVRRYERDDEFATGFYNELGGDGARDFTTNLAFFNAGDDGIHGSELAGVMAPFATLLGTATRSGGLERGFTAGFLRTDIPVRDRYAGIGGHEYLAAFLMAGPAANYSPRFLRDMGRELLIAPQEPSEEGDGVPHFDLSERQDFMAFMAGNPEAAGLLLAGRHGPDDYFSNVAPLLLHGERYTDGGEALGALVEAGTHDLRATNLALANDASHAVILGAPQFTDTLPDGVKPALVTILDDHIVDFEYLATERALPDVMDRPAGIIAGLTYEEGQEYLAALVGDDDMRGDATRIVGERVGDDIYRAAAQNDTAYANRAGALSEMAVLATADAELDSAKTEDAMNNFAGSAAEELLNLTPPDKVPGFGTLAEQALGEVFPTDAVERALEERTPAQIDAFQQVKQLSIATQVALDQLPPQALDMLQPDGSIDISIVDGPRGDEDVIRVDSNGDGEPDRNLEWDLDGDGTIDADEREITERELYDAGLGHAEAAADAMTNLHDVQYDGRHPPDIDDLPLPAGLDNDNPSGFERAWYWPFDAPGEGTISNGSEVVASQDDLRWDPAERVYHLPVEGSSTELHYRRFGEDWRLVEKVDGEWQPVG